MGGSVSQRALTRAASVSPKVAAKIIEEVESAGLIDPSTVKQVRATSAGSKTLNIDDEMLLLGLRMCGSRFIHEYDNDDDRTTTRKILLLQQSTTDDDNDSTIPIVSTSSLLLCLVSSHSLTRSTPFVHYWTIPFASVSSIRWIGVSVSVFENTTTRSKPNAKGSVTSLTPLWCAIIAKILAAETLY